MMSISPRYSPAPKTASIAAATHLRKDQLEHTDKRVHERLDAGTRMPVNPPEPLTVSGRVIVATFLLPYEATIDLEEGRSWVDTSLYLPGC